MVVPTLIKRLAEVVRVASARRRSSLPEGKVVIALDGRLVFFLGVTVRANTTAHELSIKGTHGEPLSTWSERRERRLSPSRNKVSCRTPSPLLHVVNSDAQVHGFVHQHELLA